MKKMILDRLIVISNKEESSLEVAFKTGLNLIIGGNKTGKSSIIKSVFITLGCECSKVEEEWKKLISTYILYFFVGDNKFCVVRREKLYQIFQVFEDDNCCIIETDKFTNYSEALMKILDVKMTCMSKEGKKMNITPPLLFRFQYIDQDDGWNKIAEEFCNMQYIQNWKGNTNKYVCGYLSNEYYELCAKKNKVEMEIKEIQKEYDYNKSFVDQICKESSAHIEENTREAILKQIEEKILNEEELRKQQFKKKILISELENKLYIIQQSLKIIRLNLKETEKDIHFAMTQDKEIVCPTCGAKYSNEIVDQINITSNYLSMETEEKSLQKQADTIKDAINIHTEKYQNLCTEIEKLEQEVIQEQEFVNYSNYYKEKGKLEFYSDCKKQLEKLEKNIQLTKSTREDIKEKINEVKSSKRAKSIKKKIIEQCSNIAEIINFPRKDIKLRDFVQVLSHTGSETPRGIYMYHVGLYLYNLEREPNPFTFLVIDTVNQQGQDENNLKRIFDSFHCLLSEKGQVIIGTERKTGFEEQASTVLELDKKRNCLCKDTYEKHIKLFNELQEYAKNWRMINNK